MLNSIEANNLKDKVGWLCIIGSLVLYFLFRLPFDLSVLCSSPNEGYYFIHAQYFLNGEKYVYAGGPLFLFLYASVLKIFGFGTWSILAVHFICSFVIILIGILIFLITRKIFQSIFWSGLSVLIWLLMQVTPIGGWTQAEELRAFLVLEPEYFCILLSLSSIYCLLTAIEQRGKWTYPLLAGLLALFSFMFKASGCVLIVAFFCWGVYLLLTDIRLLDKYKHIFISMFLAIFIGIISFCILVCFLKKGEFLSYWKIFFSVGSYSTEFAESFTSFLSCLANFISRYTFSLSNIFLFLSALMFLIWGLIRNYFVKTTNLYLKLFCPLLSIWGIGSIGGVIAPGSYAPYYYILVWPSAAIFLVLGIKDIFNYVGFLQKKIPLTVTILILVLFFTQRLYVIFPAYIKMVKETINLNCFLQPESFQDPIKSVNEKVSNSKRPYFLKLADLINFYLPNKRDTVYIVDFSNDFYFLRPDFYLYVKRFPPTPVVNDYLHYKRYLYRRVNVLIDNLSKAPPKIIVLPQIFYLESRQDPSLKPFFIWLKQFLKQNYHLKHTLNFMIPGLNKEEAFILFERS